jgi:hypothetical protein
MTKICSRCKEIKPISEFPKNRARKDNIGVYCHICCRKYAKNYNDLIPHKKDLNMRICAICSIEFRPKTNKNIGCCINHQVQARKSGLMAIDTTNDPRKDHVIGFSWDEPEICGITY